MKVTRLLHNKVEYMAVKRLRFVRVGHLFDSNIFHVGSHNYSVIVGVCKECVHGEASEFRMH